MKGCFIAEDERNSWNTLQNVVTSNKIFKKIKAISVPITSTETILTELTHTIAEAGNYKGSLLLNINRTEDRRLTVKIKINGVVPENGVRQYFLQIGGLVTTIDMMFQSENYLETNDVITITVQSNAPNGLNLITAADNSYIAARMVIEKTY